MSYARLLTQTVTFAPPSGVGAAGDTAYGPQQTTRARVEFGTKLLYGADGTQTTCEAVIASAAEIPMGSRVWLPGDNTADTNAAKRAIRVARASDPAGRVTVYETYL
jgi:hypothetical protein